MVEQDNDGEGTRPQQTIHKNTEQRERLWNGKREDMKSAVTLNDLEEY